MKKVSFRVRNFGKEQFLTFDIDNEADLDEGVLDFLEDEEPQGIVSVIFGDEEEDCDTFSYNITDKIRLNELSNQEINAEMVLMVMRGIVKALIDMAEYRIPLSYLVLHRNYIYIDSDYQVEFICIPLEDMQEPVDVNGFLRNFIASLRFEPSENGDYVAKLLTYINNPASFNLHNLLALVEELMEENGIEIPEDDSDIYVDYQEVEEQDAVNPVKGLDEDETGAEDMPEKPETEGLSLKEPEIEDGDTVSDEPAAESEETVSEESETEGLSLKESATEEQEVVTDESIVESEEIAPEEPLAKDEEIEEAVQEEVMEESLKEDSQLEEETAVAAEEVIEESEDLEDLEDPQEVIDEEEEAEIDESDETDISEAQKIVNKLKEKVIGKDVSHDSENSEEEIEESDEEDAGKKKDSKKPLFKTKEATITGVVIQDELDEFLAEKEREEQEAHHEESGLKIKKNIKVNRASIVKNTQEELKATEEAIAESNADAATEKAEENDEAGSTGALNDSGVPKANPYLVRVNTDEKIMITKQTFKIGKASMGVDYTVKGNGAISRVHAIITSKDGIYYVKDNKSTNHTSVNGKILDDGESGQLAHDSKIMLGDEEFIFKLR